MQILRERFNLNGGHKEQIQSKMGLKQQDMQIMAVQSKGFRSRVNNGRKIEGENPNDSDRISI